MILISCIFSFSCHNPVLLMVQHLKQAFCVFFSDSKMFRYNTVRPSMDLTFFVKYLEFDTELDISNLNEEAIKFHAHWNN